MAGWDLPTEFVDEARANTPTLGLIVHGSRAVGVAREDSDYDVIRVVTEGEYARRKEADALLERRRPAGSPYVDVLYQSPGGLEWHAANPGPWTATYTSARVVFDKTGQVADLVRAIVETAGQRAYDAVPESYDSYLNSFVRSMKSWRRGDELGGRRCTWSRRCSGSNGAGRRTTTRWSRSYPQSGRRRGGNKTSSAKPSFGSSRPAIRHFNRSSNAGSSRSCVSGASNTSGAATSSR